jgi:hypothetical protein
LQRVILAVNSLNVGAKSWTASAALIHASLLSTFSARAKPAPFMPDLYVTEHDVEPLLKHRAILVREALTILRETIRRHNAENRVVEIFEVWARPTDDLGRRTLHSLDEIEQDGVGLVHCFLVYVIGRRYGRNHDAVAVERSRLDRIAFDAVYVLHDLVSALVHQHRQSCVEVVFSGPLEHQSFGRLGLRAVPPAVAKNVAKTDGPLKHKNVSI